MLGNSESIVALRAQIDRAARTAAKILILGETGVGKEVVARLIHAQSARNARPFLAVNCSGIPETLLASELFGHTRGSFTGAYRDKMGLIRQADRGTLFLDELGEMSLVMQAALLRFAETGEIQPVGADTPIGRTDVRLIAATNRDLKAQVAVGAFRLDLYYRLNVIQIRIPALRERGDDVLLLFRHYVQRASEMHRVPAPELSATAAEALLAYAWPGNVRELKNMAERLVVSDIGDTIGVHDLPAEVQEPAEKSPVSQSDQPDAGAPSLLPRRMESPTVERIWQRLMAGEDFWAAAQQPFRTHELTRAELAALIDRGLQRTRGSYRALVTMFNLPPTDYKKFHAFLYQQNCNLPVGPYRMAVPSRSAQAVDDCRPAC